MEEYYPKKYLLKVELILLLTGYSEEYTEKIHKQLETEMRLIPVTVIAENSLNAIVKGIKIYKDIMKLKNINETERLHISLKIENVEEMLPCPDF